MLMTDLASIHAFTQISIGKRCPTFPFDTFKLADETDDSRFARFQCILHEPATNR